MTTTKSPARIYGESIMEMATVKHLAAALAEILHENKASPKILLQDDDDAPLAHNEKMALLEAGRLLFLKAILSDECPKAEEVRAALMPPVFDSGKFDDCAKNGPEGAADRRTVRGSVMTGMRVLQNLINVYAHELSHATVAEHFGAESEINVIVMPEMQIIGEEGYGISLTIKGGRCRLSAELPPEQRAVINVAGHMGELLCATLKNMEAPAEDVDFWLKSFADIHAGGDGEESTHKETFHNGSYSDAVDFYKCAPTEEERRAAILKAGEILFANWADILAAAVHKSLLHLTTMGHVMAVMSTAMDMAEAAASGCYGEVVVKSVVKE